MTSIPSLIDGRPAAHVPVADRGFCYGDGLFETIRISAGRPVWWDAHLARLARGCAVLGLAMPDAALLAAEQRQLCGKADGVLRLALTRREGGRGYLPESAATRRTMTLHPPPTVGARLTRDGEAPRVALKTRSRIGMGSQSQIDGHRGSFNTRGLAIDWATLQLAIQPRLAGLKHLNRLEQVLAAGECRDAGLDELLLCDSDGAVTSAVAANLFLVRAGRLETPLLDRCGVAGTCREWILRQHPECQVRRLQRADVEAADELFLSNSVRGILPVARLGPRALPEGEVTRALQRQLGKAVPAFAAEPEQ